MRCGGRTASSTYPWCRWSRSREARGDCWACGALRAVWCDVRVWGVAVKVAVISANLGQGGYDQPAPWPDLIAPDGVEIDVIRLTDETFQPRPLAMTSRLQCGIPKWFGADFAPDASVIIWIDASCAPTPYAVSWFLAYLSSADIAVFRHPDRRTVRDEYEFVKARMARPGETYLNSRYRGEDLEGVIAAIEREYRASDVWLYASTAFAYWSKRNHKVREALAEVFAWKARFHLHDQFAFPFVLMKHGLNVNVIPDNYLRCPALEFVRKGIRRSA